VRADAGGAAADGGPTPQGPGQEQAMILTGLIIIIAVIMLLTVRRIRRKP
jgi:hypothetical protein